VFPDADGKIETVDSSVDVEARWQQLKNSEKARSSVLDGVPASLPPLTHASKILQRLKNAGMNPPVSANGMEVVENAVAHGISPTELMIAAIHHLRIADTDPETAMRQQVAALRKAITDIELSREG
jgi:XTP/dITP diphosphohydrolase